VLRFVEAVRALLDAAAARAEEEAEEAEDVEPEEGVEEADPDRHSRESGNPAEGSTEEEEEGKLDPGSGPG